MALTMTLQWLLRGEYLQWKGRREVVIKMKCIILLFQFSLIFMQTFKHDQGQHGFYLSYQHTLKNQYCLQSYSCFSTALRKLPSATIHKIVWQPHSQSHRFLLLGPRCLPRGGSSDLTGPAGLPAQPLTARPGFLTGSIPAFPKQSITGLIPPSHLSTVQ